MNEQELLEVLAIMSQEVASLRQQVESLTHRVDVLESSQTETPVWRIDEGD